MMKLELLSNNPKTILNDTPILFVHGMWHGAWCWDKFLAYFEKKGLKAFALSLSNHANSEKRKAFNLLRINDYVKDVAQIVATFDKKPILVGHSMGGFVVQKYLENHSVQGAVLISSVPPFGIWDGTLSVLKNFTGAFLKANVTLNLKHIINSNYKYKHILCSEEFSDKNIEEYQKLVDTESYLAYVDMLGLNLVNVKKVKKNKTPFLIIGGGKDAALSRKSVLKTAIKYNTEAVIFENMPHMMMLSLDYSKVADKIINWIENS